MLVIVLCCGTFILQPFVIRDWSRLIRRGAGAREGPSLARALEGEAGEECGLRAGPGTHLPDPHPLPNPPPSWLLPLTGCAPSHSGWGRGSAGMDVGNTLGLPQSSYSQSPRCLLPPLILPSFLPSLPPLLSSSLAHSPSVHPSLLLLVFSFFFPVRALTVFFLQGLPGTAFLPPLYLSLPFSPSFSPSLSFSCFLSNSFSRKASFKQLYRRTNEWNVVTGN